MVLVIYIVHGTTDTRTSQSLTWSQTLTGNHLHNRNNQTEDVSKSCHAATDVFTCALHMGMYRDKPMHKHILDEALLAILFITPTQYQVPYLSSCLLQWSKTP